MIQRPRSTWRCQRCWCWLFAKDLTGDLGEAGEMCALPFAHDRKPDQKRNVIFLRVHIHRSPPTFSRYSDHRWNGIKPKKRAPGWTWWTIELLLWGHWQLDRPTTWQTISPLARLRRGQCLFSTARKPGANCQRRPESQLLHPGGEGQHQKTRLPALLASNHAARKRTQHPWMTSCVGMSSSLHKWPVNHFRVLLEGLMMGLRLAVSRILRLESGLR